MTDRALLHYRGDNISFAGDGEKKGKRVGRGKARKREEKNEKWRKAAVVSSNINIHVAIIAYTRKSKL